MLKTRLAPQIETSTKAWYLNHLYSPAPLCFFIKIIIKLTEINKNVRKIPRSFPLSRSTPKVDVVFSELRLKSVSSLDFV